MRWSACTPPVPPVQSAAPFDNCEKKYKLLYLLCPEYLSLFMGNKSKFRRKVQLYIRIKASCCLRFPAYPRTLNQKWNIDEAEQIIHEASQLLSQLYVFAGSYCQLFLEDMSLFNSSQSPKNSLLLQTLLQSVRICFDFSSDTNCFSSVVSLLTHNMLVQFSRPLWFQLLRECFFKVAP